MGLIRVSRFRVYGLGESTAGREEREAMRGCGKGEEWEMLHAEILAFGWNDALIVEFNTAFHFWAQIKIFYFCVQKQISQHYASSSQPKPMSMI